MALPPDPAPFAELTPHRILDLLDAVGIRGDGRLLQLNSYENRVVQVGLEAGGSVVVKFYRPDRWSDEQILEEHAFAAELDEAEVPVAAPLRLNLPEPLVPIPPSDASAPDPVAPPVLLGPQATLARQGRMRWAVSPCLPGQSPDLDDPAVLQRIGAALGRLHTVGRRRDYQHRPRLDLVRLGQDARATVLACPQLPMHLARPWAERVDALLARCAAAFAALPGLRWIRTHGDCHIGNLRWTAQGPCFVDLDDSGLAPAVQDLWMLLPEPGPEADRALQALLAGYRAFADLAPAELSLIEPLRALRMIHHRAWLAERWPDPAFPPAFPWFEQAGDWQDHLVQLERQLDRMGG